MTARFTVKHIILQSIPVLLGVLFLSIITGSRLEDEYNLIINYHPVLLIALPAFVNVTGDLADVLSSRITSLLYSGRLSPSFKPFTIFLANLFGILAVSFTVFITVGVAGNIIAGLVFHYESPWVPLMTTIIGSGFFATVVMICVSLIIIFFTYKKGMDPDSITPPITTTGGDLVGTLTLLFLANIFLGAR